MGPSVEIDIPVDKPIILFDGVCNLCNGAVQFIIDHEKNDDLRFASLQSEIAENLLKKFDLNPETTNSFVFIELDRAFLRSTAALKVSRYLKSPWNWAYVFIAVPTFLRDFFYNIIARTRYSIFGKRNECMVPTPDLRAKFLN